VTRAGWLRLAVIIGALALIEVACRIGWIPPITMIPPSKMVATLVELLQSGKYAIDILATLSNVSIAIVLATSVGVLVGTGLHGVPSVRGILDPLFATYYAVPMYAFYPLLIVVLGLGDWPQVAIGFLLGVMAVIINTLNGLDRVPPVLLKAARVHRLGGVKTALLIRLPHAAPYIFTGFKLAVAYSFIGVIGAEFITSSRGIGYEISFAYNNFDNPLMYAFILMVLIVVIAINMSLYMWERRLLARRGK